MSHSTRIVYQTSRSIRSVHIVDIFRHCRSYGNLWKKMCYAPGIVNQRWKVYLPRTYGHFRHRLTQKRWFSVTYIIGRNKPIFLGHVLKVVRRCLSIRKGIYM